MSIISDALKKVQENKTQHKEETQTQVPEEILKSKPKKKEPNPIILILVLFLVVCVGGFFFIVLSSVRTTPPDKIAIVSPEEIKVPSVTPKVESPKDEPASTMRLHPYITSTNLPSQASMGNQSFTLNGIVFDDVKPYAIINDTILENGDWLGEARVVSIQKNKVTLSADSKEFTLILK